MAVDLDNAKIVDALVYLGRATTTVKSVAVNVDVVPAGEMEPVIGNLSGITIEGGRSYSVFTLGLVHQMPAGENVEVVFLIFKLQGNRLLEAAPLSVIEQHKIHEREYCEIYY